MEILVYTRNSRIADDGPAMKEQFGGAGGRVRFRNAVGHTTGDLEACDVVYVDDHFPNVAEDYREGYIACEVRLFDAGELGTAYATPPPEDAFRELFASVTAFELARDHELTEADLEEIEPAGKTGYTTAQVRALRGD